MILPGKIFLIAVPVNWYQMVKAQYIASGSGSANCWGIKQRNEKNPVHPEPGALVLFTMNRDHKVYVCGGGFFEQSISQTPSEAWKDFGVYNGAEDIEEFKFVLSEHGLKRGGRLKSNVVSGIFIFSRKDCYELPSEMELPSLNQGELLALGLDTPQGLFLAKHIMQLRQGQLREYSSDPVWPGIYRMAEQKNARDYSAFFTAKMMQAYDFKCAITQEKVHAVLKVAHIKAFYDERFLKPCNGLVLRADIESLFAQGYLTAVYTAKDQAVTKISQVLKGSDYMKYDGAPLYLPEDPALRPNPEYLEWHAKNRFENWLAFGAVKPLKV